MSRLNLIPALIQRVPEVVQGFAAETGKPVQVVSADALGFLRVKSAELAKQYGLISEQERKRVRGFLLLLDAIRAGDEDKRYEVAAELADLKWPAWIHGQQRLFEQFAGADTSHNFLALQVSHRVKMATLVLWHEPEKTDLMPGLLCRNIEDALCALIFFSLCEPSAAANCVVCGAVLVRASKGGDRRKTCSARCRTRASRAARQQK